MSKNATCLFAGREPFSFDGIKYQHKRIIIEHDDLSGI